MRNKKIHLFIIIWTVIILSIFSIRLFSFHLSFTRLVQLQAEAIAQQIKIGLSINKDLKGVYVPYSNEFSSQFSQLNLQKTAFNDSTFVFHLTPKSIIHIFSMNSEKIEGITVKLLEAHSSNKILADQWETKALTKLGKNKKHSSFFETDKINGEKYYRLLYNINSDLLDYESYNKNTRKSSISICIPSTYIDIVKRKNLRGIIFIYSILYLLGIISYMLMRRNWAKKNISYKNQEKHSRELSRSLEKELERRQLQSFEIRKNKIKFETIFDLVTDAVFLIDNNIIVECNQSATRLFGYTKQELVGATPSLITPPKQKNGKDSDPLCKNYMGAVLNGQNQEFEWTYIKKNQELFYAHVSLNNMVLINEKLVMAVVRDITAESKYKENLEMFNTKLEEQKAQLEQELINKQIQNLEIEKNKIQFETIFNLSDNGIFLMNEDKIIACNNATVSLFGYAKDEITNQTIDLINPDKQEDNSNSSVLSREHINTALEKESAEFDWVHKRKDGSSILTHIKLKSFYLSGKKLIMSIIQDTSKENQYKINLEQLNSELKKQTKDLLKTSEEIEQEKEKYSMLLQSKVKLLNYVSSEIKNPTNSTSAILKLLKTTELDQKQQEYVCIIESANIILTHYVNDVIDFHNVIENKVKLNTKSYLLKDNIKFMYDSIRPILNDKDVTSKLQINESIDSYYSYDKRKLQQVLISLLYTAASNTTKGFIYFDVNIQKTRPDYNTINFRIHHTGKSFSNEQKEFLNRIHLDIADTENYAKEISYSNLKLDTIIPKHLATLMSGDILVEDNKEETIININIPLLKSPTGLPYILPEPTHNQEFNILIFEPLILCRKIFSLFLNSKGHSIFFSENDQKGFKAFQEQKFDFVFINLDLPNEEGYKTAEGIRKLEAENSNTTRIIGVIPYEFKLNKERCKALQISDFVTKPIEQSNLFRAIYS